MHQSFLHVAWEAGGDAVTVSLQGIQPLRLKEYLVLFLIGEADYLILYGGAVAGPHGLYLAGVEWCPVEVFPDYFVGFGIGVSNITRDLWVAGPLQALLC